MIPASFSEGMLLGRWGTQSVYQSCRVQTAEALAAAGLYDESVVTVDVWPGAFPNVVIASAAGRLPVAILSTAGFDATRIVPGSLRTWTSGLDVHGSSIEVIERNVKDSVEQGKHHRRDPLTDTVHAREKAVDFGRSTPSPEVACVTAPLPHNELGNFRRA